ncbi:hypothetical protein KGF57_002431 [Candida theae]|uniref:Uncharacterized protein n=1 Tax=Candida theae TaxID=1198502 RepID=A0AAD5FYZ4_9ASCO|nr:uncharacterized protein KGF57_002431 [Candida theae]KAI5958586.1 hypothetical protein KGF57_002431 [Candida theae]
MDQPSSMIYVEIDNHVDLIYRRKFKKDGNGDGLDPVLARVSYDGFPDAKFLKNLVKNKIDEVERRRKSENGDGDGDAGTEGASAHVGDHLIGKGSLLNQGGTVNDEETELGVDPGDCVDCRREE